MTDYFDQVRDRVHDGDCLNSNCPEKQYVRNKITHYVFNKDFFNNPKYVIPSDNLELFKKFLEGGSREYPSDGNIPVDIVAHETEKILDLIEETSKDENNTYCKAAKKAMKSGRLSLVRGTIKLYLGDYTTRDWRRKRFTDDIDFWITNPKLFEYATRKTGWNKDNKTKEWSKRITWYNPFKDKTESKKLIASNDINQLLDFGAGEYLHGSTLKDVFEKKIKRGHDVDLSDIINVAIVNNTLDDVLKTKWVKAWTAFEQAANTRNTRTTSNMISLCRYAYGVADYLERIGEAIKEYKHLVNDDNKYSDCKILKICSYSSHWLETSVSKKPNGTRRRIYKNLKNQDTKKKEYAKNLRNFADKVLKLINSKHEHARIIFEII